MSIAINIKNFALITAPTIDASTLTPLEDWIVDPIFDDELRAFEVGPAHWVISGNNVHVKTALEIDADPAAVDAAILVRRNEVNNLREKTFYAGFLDSNGTRWSSTPVDIANINAVCTLVAVGAVTADQTWRDFDNVDHQLSPAGLIGLAAQMAVFGKTCYGVAWHHKSNLEALTKVSDVASYDITTGWPT